MRGMHRFVPLAASLAASLAAMLVAAFVRPRPVHWLHSIVLVLVVFAGAYALARALIGVAARRVGWLEGTGGILLAAGLFLVGARFLPFAGARAATFTTGGTLLCIAGLALQVRAFVSR